MHPDDEYKLGQVTLPPGLYTVVDHEIRVWSPDTAPDTAQDSLWVLPGYAVLSLGKTHNDGMGDVYAIVLIGGSIWHITSIYAPQLRPI